jgi:hypothetical protein
LVGLKLRTTSPRSDDLAATFANSPLFMLKHCLPDAETPEGNNSEVHNLIAIIILYQAYVKLAETGLPKWCSKKLLSKNFKIMMQTMNQRGNMACSFQTKSNGSWFLLFFYCIFQSTCSVCPYYNWWGIIQFV